MPDPPAVANRRRLSARRPDELLAMTFPPDDDIWGDHILALGQNTCLVGPPGVGKSRLALQIATASTVHWPAIGLPTKRPPRGWLFLQAENSSRRLKADFEWLRKWTGPRLWPEVNANIVVHTLETDFDGVLSLDGNDAVKLCGDLIQEHNPSVVVWDTLQSFNKGDLNHDRDMFATVSTMSQLTKQGDPERIPWILHHASPGRAAAARALGTEKGTFGRNSKALLGWARSQVNLAPGGTVGVIVVSCAKLSDGKEFAPFAIRLNPDTMIYEVDRAFNLLSWQAEMANPNPPVITAEGVAELCNGGMKRKELENAIVAATGCNERTARRAIVKAIDKGTVTDNKDLGLILACLPARS